MHFYLNKKQIHEIMNEKLIDYEVPTIQFNQSVESCLELFEVYKYAFLPVLNDENELVNIINEDQIIHAKVYLIHEIEQTQSRLILQDEIPAVEAIRILNINHSDILFAVDSQNKYLGAITNDSLMHFIRNQWMRFEYGTLLVLETAILNYQLKDIVRIFESEGIQILSFWTQSHIENQTIEISVHLDKNDLKNCIGIFQNYKYSVIYTMNEVGYKDFIKERYESLIHYLNI